MTKEKKSFLEKQKSLTGFTVTELIVAMGVFAVLLTAAVGVFVQALRSERRLLDLMAVNNNAGLVLEQIIREIRTGRSFQIPDGAAACGIDGGTELNFTNFLDKNIIYRLNQNNAIEKEIEDEASSTLTASNVSIENLCFTVQQFENNICAPWRVTILMKVSSKTQPDILPVDIQTTVSSRILPREIENDPFSCR